MAMIEVPDFLILQLYTGGVMERLDRLEAAMTEMSGALAEQGQAINELAERIDELDAGALQEQVNQLTAALDAERQARAELQAAFEADEELDAQTEQSLRQAVTDAEAATADARAQLDSTTADLVSGVQGVQENTARLRTLAAPATPENPEG